MGKINKSYTQKRTRDFHLSNYQTLKYLIKIYQETIRTKKPAGCKVYTHTQINCACMHWKGATQKEIKKSILFTNINKHKMFD